MYGSTPPGVLPAPGGGGTPLYKPYRYVPHPRVGFLCRFGLKTGIHLNYFRLESSMIFKGIGNYGSVWTYLSFHSKWVRKKEKYANSKRILRNLFCCCSNLSHNDPISLRPGLKTSMDSRGQAWKRVWEMTFNGLRQTLASVTPFLPSQNPRNNIRTQVTR